MKKIIEWIKSKFAPKQVESFGMGDPVKETKEDYHDQTIAILLADAKRASMAKYRAIFNEHEIKQPDFPEGVAMDGCDSLFPSVSMSFNFVNVAAMAHFVQTGAL